MKLTDISEFTQHNQWSLYNEQLIISLPLSIEYMVDPNNSNVYGDILNIKGVGLVYPWAMRPDFISRGDDYDVFDYGEDDLAWTLDDNYAFYGYNVAESHFTRWSNSENANWQASDNTYGNIFNDLVHDHDIFGSVNYLSMTNMPLLAHSQYSSTWPADR